MNVHDMYNVDLVNHYVLSLSHRFLPDSFCWVLRLSGNFQLNIASTIRRWRKEERPVCDCYRRTANWRSAAPTNSLLKLEVGGAHKQPARRETVHAGKNARGDPAETCFCKLRLWGWLRCGKSPQPSLWSRISRFARSVGRWSLRDRYQHETQLRLSMG